MKEPKCFWSKVDVGDPEECWEGLACRQAKKLTEEQVLGIRQLYATGEWTHRKLADAFGVSRSNISKIIREDYWRY